MVLPFYDGAPLRYVRHPFANWSLIGLNIAVFLCVTFGLFGLPDGVDLAFGVIPAVLTGHAILDPDVARIPPYLTLLTGMFLHGGWLHIGGNMLFLWVFGDNVEDGMGSLRYVVFYLLCGVAGGLTFCALGPSEEVTLIGASGAISGVLVASLMLYPRVRIWTLVFDILPLRLPAFIVVLAWILFQVISVFTGSNSDVAFGAHLGGILAGVVLTPLFKRREVPLFGPRRN